MAGFTGGDVVTGAAGFAFVVGVGAGAGVESELDEPAPGR
jgi:hypothetical protein